MNIIQYPIIEKQYIKQETEKKYIVLHGSGTRTRFSPKGGKKYDATNVIKDWEKNKDKFSCAYLIDRNGTITQTFDDKYWSHHLNIPGHGVYDRMSIGIELVNELGLLKENNLFYINDYIYHQNVYVGPVFEKDFRRYKNWADLDLLQVEALVGLIDHLCKKHNIIPIFYNSLEFDPKAWNKGNIFTHAVVNNKTNDLPLNQWVSNKLHNKYFKIVKSKPLCPMMS
jgi:N-acetyl-anhydromuramyl-L-alanine amidase AmpD